MAKAKFGGNAGYALLALLILSLGGFGVTNFGGSVREIATVGERKISVDDYARALTDEARSVSQQLGQTVGMAELLTFGRDGAVRGALIAEAALDNETARIGLSAGDAEVMARLTQIPSFQGLSGSFDREAYRFALRNERMSEAEFETGLRDEAARELFVSAIAGGVAAPLPYAEVLAGWALERRDFTHAELIEADLPAPVPEPTEAELAAFHTENIADFTAPEARVVTYVWLRPEALLDQATPDEEALMAAYETRRAEFVIPEQRLVERLVFADAEAAAAARAEIDAGTRTLVDFAQARGLGLADIDLGEVSQAQLGPAGEVVFALDGPGIAGPVETPLGPALFAVNAILPGEETPFEEARDELAAELALDRARRLILERSAGIEDALAGGATLEEIAGEAGMELAQIEVTEATDTGIAGYAGFREAALAAALGDYPDLSELEDGGIFALRLDAIRPPEPIPLDAVKERVAQGWRAAETDALLNELAAETLAQLANGATLEGLGLVVTRHAATTRREFIEGLDPAILDKAYLTERGQHAAIEAAGGVHLIRVDAVTPTLPDDPEVLALKASIEGQLRQSLASDIYAAYVTALQTEAGIVLDQAAIGAVHAQMR